MLGWAPSVDALYWFFSSQSNEEAHKMLESVFSGEHAARLEPARALLAQVRADSKRSKAQGEFSWMNGPKALLELFDLPTTTPEGKRKSKDGEISSGKGIKKKKKG